MSLASLYGGSSDTSTPTTISTPNYVGSTPIDAPADTSAADIGKTSFDFTDPVKSVIGAVGNIGGFLGTIGNIGLDNGPHISDIFGAAGRVVGAVGEVGVPGLQVKDFVGGAINQAGNALHVLSIPEQMIEGVVARQRLEAAQRDPLHSQHDPVGALPPDIARRLAQGEDIQTLADEMVANGQGWSSNLSVQTGLSILGDPLNLAFLGLGAVSKTATVVRTAQNAAREAATLGTAEAIAGAEAAQKAVSEINPFSRAAGYAYVQATAGGNALVRGVVERAIGPATSGLADAYGASRVARVQRLIDGESPGFREAWDQAFGSYHRFELDSALGKSLGANIDEASRGVLSLQEIGDRIGAMASRLTRSKAIAKQIEQDIKIAALRNRPAFLTVPEAELTATSIRKLSEITGMSPEAAARVLGKKIDIETHQLIDGVYSGKANRTLAEVVRTERAKVAGTKAEQQVQWDRVTRIGDRGLTNQRADAILADYAEDPTTLEAAIAKYPIIGDRFSGVDAAERDIVDYIKQLRNSDSLPDELGNRLPKALQAWRTEHEWSGQVLGYAPESGWKATLVANADGELNLVPTEPWVPITVQIAGVNIRNPLGRFGDSLFAAVHQRQLVLTSESRMVRLGVDGEFMSPREATIIHRTLFKWAADRGVSPRGLVALPGTTKEFANPVQEAFAKHLSHSQYQKIVRESSPEFLFLQATRGKVGEVGLTQALTGAVKAKSVQRFGGAGLWVTKLSEYYYPLAKFRLNPFFQLQEKIETRFFSVLHGVRRTEASPDVKAFFDNVFATDPNFRHLSEEWSSLYVERGTAAAGQIVDAMPGLRQRLGNSVTGFFNVAEPKRQATIAQMFFEHPAEFRQAMTDVDPAMWGRMIEAYGTTDERIIARKFIEERLALAKANAEEVARMAGPGPVTGMFPNEVFGEAAKPVLKATADMETAWNAYVYSLRKSAQVAQQTQYFREGRGFLERTLNHPFLGIYPLSYASKVYVEFARFLLKTPFGLDAPLVGISALSKIQRSLLSEDFQSSDFQKALAANPHWVNFIVQMLPYLPTDVSANVPLWARNVAKQADKGAKVPADQRAQKGQNVTPGDIATAITDQLSLQANPLRILKTAGDLYDELWNDLSGVLGSSSAPTTPPDASTGAGYRFAGLRPEGVSADRWAAMTTPERDRWYEGHVEWKPAAVSQIEDRRNEQYDSDRLKTAWQLYRAGERMPGSGDLGS